jgi:glutamate 5-kinase
MAISEARHIPTAKRIVVKVGSSSISGENTKQLEVLVVALAEAHQRGCEVVLVSSGAIATGMPLLKLESKPDD